MNTDHEFFLMQFSDSFFPSGMFSLSNGLESLVKRQVVKNDKDVLNFIEQQIEFQIVPCDCMIFLAAFDAVRNKNVEELVQADKRFYSMRLIKEARNSSVRSGSQILNCAIQMALDKDDNKIAKQFQKLISSNHTPGTYPACLGIITSIFGIPPESGIRIMLYSFSQSIVGAAIRLGVIEHIAGQKTLSSLSIKINDISKNIKKQPLDNLWQLTPLTDIFQMMHEYDNSKMFIT